MKKNHHAGWDEKEEKDLFDAMEKRTSSITSAARKFARTVGRTPGAIHTKYNVLKKRMKSANTSHIPNSATIPQHIFNDNVKKIEDITGHIFTPSEIVELDQMLKH